MPGRNELDDTQELNYPPILRALVDTGYTGFVGQEFIPLRDKATSLAEAVERPVMPDAWREPGAC